MKLKEKIFILKRKFKNMLTYAELESRELTPEEARKANIMLETIETTEKELEAVNKP